MYLTMIMLFVFTYQCHLRKKGVRLQNICLAIGIAMANDDHYAS